LLKEAKDKPKFQLARLDTTRLDSTHRTCRAHAFWLCRLCRTAQLDSLDKVELDWLDWHLIHWQSYSLIHWIIFHPHSVSSFFLFYLHVRSKYKTLNLYTQALLLLRRPPCWKSTARQSRTCRVVSSRAKWNWGHNDIVLGQLQEFLDLPPPCVKQNTILTKFVS